MSWRAQATIKGCNTQILSVWETMTWNKKHKIRMTISLISQLLNVKFLFQSRLWFLKIMKSNISGHNYTTHVKRMQRQGTTCMDYLVPLAHENTDIKSGCGPISLLFPAHSLLELNFQPTLEGKKFIMHCCVAVRLRFMGLMWSVFFIRRL